MRFFLLFIILSTHNNFEEIIFIDEGRLLEEYSEEEYDDYYDHLKKRFFGWNSYIVEDQKEVYFVSDTLFSYSNQSNESISYKYVYETGKDIKDSVAVTGGISTNASTKAKGFNLKFDNKLQSKISVEQSKSITEKWQLDIDVPPFTKMSLKIRGEGRISNGVSHLYIFFIKVKEGGWEVLDVTKEYYWLVEEYV
ncbi:hypothetical protein RI065_08015 [Mycoplasmatota bacterium zrk1]